MSHAPYRKSYELIEAELLAVPESDLRHPNVDAPSAVLTVIGALPTLLTLRPLIERELPRFPLDTLDKLEAYAKGFGHAHALYLASRAPSTTVAGLAAQAEQTSAQLEEAARPLAARGLLDAGQCARLTVRAPGRRSYKTAVFRLIGFVELFREGAARVTGKTLVTDADLADAERLAAALGDAIGLREHGDPEEGASSDSALNRRRAYTLFWNAYDQVRRAVLYLRWDTQDADRFAPSLYAGRSSARAPIDDDAPASDGPPSASGPSAEP